MTWIDIKKEKPTEMAEYQVKVKDINLGYINERKALWVPEEEKFYSDQFPVSENSNIVCWKYEGIKTSDLRKIHPNKGDYMTDEGKENVQANHIPLGYEIDDFNGIKLKK